MPPQNDEAEVAVLGTVLHDRAGARPDPGRPAPRAPRTSTGPRHQLIFRAMVRLKQKAEPEAIDAITVCDDLRAREPARGGRAARPTSTRCPRWCPSVHAVRDYAQIVRDHSILRKLLVAAREIQEQGRRPTAAIRGRWSSRPSRRSSAPAHDEDSSQLRSIEDVLHEELDKLERLSKEGTSLTGTPSGFTDLDEITGGFQPGNLIVLAARPAMGKIRAGHQHRRERRPSTTARRWRCSRSRCPRASWPSASSPRGPRSTASRCARAGSSPSSGRRCWPRRRSSRKAPLFIDDSSDLGVLELRAKARRLHQRHPLGLLIVDYLQLMRAGGPARRPRRAGRQDQPRAEDPGARAAHPGDRDLPALARGRGAARQAADDGRPAGERQHRAGRRPRDVRLPRRVLQQGGLREAGDRARCIIGKHRNGPVGLGRAHLPRPLSEVREHRVASASRRHAAAGVG